MMDQSLILTYAIGTLLVIATGVLAAAAALRRPLRVPLFVPAAVITLSVYLLVAQILKLWALKNYVDLTVWLQVVDGIARGDGPVSGLQESLVPGTRHWLSVHFTPLVYLVALPYSVVRRPETLLVTQFALLLLALMPLYLYARQRLGSGRDAFVVAALLVLYPTYQYIHLYEFEMLRFSILAILFAWYALETGRPWLFAAAAGLALLVREEVAITVALIGLYAAAFRRPLRGAGLAVAGFAVAYFFIVTQVVMPALRGPGGGAEHVGAYWFGTFGRTPVEVVRTVLTHPLKAAATILQPVKLANLFMYLLPLLFLPLLDWPVLATGLGSVAVGLLSGSIVHSSYFLYYLSPFVAVVFAALVGGIDRAGRWLEARSGPGSGRPAVLFGLLCAALVANAAFGPSPLSVQFWVDRYRLAPFRTLDFHYRHYLPSSHHRAASRMARVIPQKAGVSAEQFLLPLLHDRAGLRVFPDIGPAAYVFIDKRNPLKSGISTVPGSWEGLRRNPQAYYDIVERDPRTWLLVAAEDGYYVYSRIR